MHVLALALWAGVVACTSGQVPTRLDMPLLKQLTASRSDNQAVSPFLVTDLLTQLWIGARGFTRSEIGQATGVNSIYQLGYAYPPANYALSLASSVATTAVFNRLYINKEFSIKPSFPALINIIYGAQTRVFDKVPDAVAEINADVANVTRGRINDLVNDGTLQGAQLVIVSALYFNGSWEKAFMEGGSSGFLTAAGEKKVPMMKLKKRLEYVAFGDFDVVSLPYSHEDYSMLVLRPLQRSKAGVKAFHDKLDSLNLESIYRQIAGKVRDVDVLMPKFKIESSHDMKPTLKALGIKRIFTSAADLSGISNEQILVSQFVHKVFMDVNERGTEAAGAGAVVITRTSIGPQSVSFTVDRSFLAVLYHNKLNLNLFSAWVANPIA